VCARELVPRLVLERLQADVNSELVSAINIGGPRNTRAPAKDLLPSIKSSIKRVSNAGDYLTLDNLSKREKAHRTVLQNALKSEEWLKEFPGRLVLRRFADEYLSGKIDAQMFSNLVLDKMVERSVKPEPMKVILDKIAEV
jgi:hypothetical protein